ncbi:DUF2171 domain-containing protein [Sphingomonas sp. CFBP8993]|uniref:DUF2171 domain-containing protein n=1 Tax=Sphingomonas sp. CFBP8993 TaxID=3096526 RepID=UPI002A6A7F35|nr:DUF2171 domain-containing protein [Sphingomonas sp. CFBP8993]MDY0959052.1 DUF2171 domain-containing protein [Sphingomonas sp. CFBP8993]
MAYDRYSRDANRGDRDFDYGRDYGSGRDYTYSSARKYDAAGAFDNERNDDDRDQDSRRGYGARDYGQQGYGRQGYDTQSYGRDNDYPSSLQDFGGRSNEGRYGEGRSGAYGAYRGSEGGYGRDQDRDAYRGGERNYGRNASYGDSSRGYGYTGDRFGRDDRQERGDYGRQQQGRDYGRQRGGDYGRQPQGYDYDDRGFFARAGDEVRSWFGDEEAERRREADARFDERHYAQQDHDYNHWRTGQIAALDRDYDEYRSENRTKFQNEFSTWRTEREGQRGLLLKVKEHQEVVGSDGSHVGTVDKVRGDRILLTKNDKDAGGQHHSIPSRWLKSVEDKVTLTKTAEEAKAQWRDEENARAMFGDRTNENDRYGQANRYGQTGTSGQSSGYGQSATGTTSSAQNNSATGSTSTTGTTTGTGSTTGTTTGIGTTSSSTSDTSRGY